LYAENTNVRATKSLHVGCYLNKYLNVKLRNARMTYEQLKGLVGDDNAVRVYDYFVGFTVDNLVQLVLDGYTPSQLINLAKELSDES
jgi:hypothetical protein